jgi:hypothetical protein
MTTNLQRDVVILLLCLVEGNKKKTKRSRVLFASLFSFFFSPSFLTFLAGYFFFDFPTPLLPCMSISERELLFAAESLR